MHWTKENVFQHSCCHQSFSNGLYTALGITCPHQYIIYVTIISNSIITPTPYQSPHEWNHASMIIMDHYDLNMFNKISTDFNTFSSNSLSSGCSRSIYTLNISKASRTLFYLQNAYIYTHYIHIHACTHIKTDKNQHFLLIDMNIHYCCVWHVHIYE